MSERSISPFEKYGAARPVEDASLQIRVFTSTDTLSGIAYEFYGDWRLWRIVAERNKIIDPRRVAVGSPLVIPRRPLEPGRYPSL